MTVERLVKTLEKLTGKDVDLWYECDGSWVVTLDYSETIRPRRYAVAKGESRTAALREAIEEAEAGFLP